MKKYTVVIFTLVIMVLDTRDFVSTTQTTKHEITHLREVPDSSLILLDRVNLKKSLPASEYARKRKQNVQETNSTESSASFLKPCSCNLGVCTCCTGPLLDLINQKACMKVTYTPGDFAFDVAMLINNRIVYENSLSGKNPKPICISPPRMPNLNVCAKFYNVFFPGRNFHFCLRMTGKWSSMQLFDIVFDCLRMGANGITMLKPEDSGGLVIPNPQGGVDAVIDQGYDDIEEYDDNVVRSLLEIFD